jgi:hypothetical protein
VAVTWGGSKNLVLDTAISTVNSAFLTYTASSYTGLSFLLGDTNEADYHAGLGSSFILYSQEFANQGTNRLDGTSANFGATARPQKRTLYSMVHTSAAGHVSQISKDRSQVNRSWHGEIQEIILYTDPRTSKRDDIESNVGDYFTQNTPLLDTYSGAAAAYSLRRLSSSYQGSAVEVFNTISYADIGFNVFGELDTVALAAHCGSNNGFVSKWYDQSGNTNDAAQTATNNMPKIYDGTTGVVTEGSAGNEKPAVEFDGSDYFSFNSRIYAARTMIAVLNLNLFQYNRLCSNSVEIKNSGKGWVNGGGGSGINEQFNINAVSVNGVVDTTSPYGSNLIGLYNLSYFTGNGVDSDGLGEIGWHDANRSLLGKLQEFILYPVEDTANRTDIEDNINTFYDIY